MPLTAEMMIQDVPGQMLANGTQLTTSEPHPLLRQLEAKCHDGTASEVEDLLNDIGPLPPLDDIPIVALSCLQRATLLAAYRPDQGILTALLRNGFGPYKLSVRLVNEVFKQNNTQTLAVLIQGGWDINEAGPGLEMRPLLRHAVNDSEMRNFLLSHGADPLVENERRLTPLETAASQSTGEVLEELIAHGGDPKKDDSLLHAVDGGRLDNAKVLVAHGADVNQLEKEYPLPWGKAPRRTPLDAAIVKCRPTEDAIDPHPQVERMWAAGAEMKAWLVEQGATARNLESQS